MRRDREVHNVDTDESFTLAQFRFCDFRNEKPCTGATSNVCLSVLLGRMGEGIVGGMGGNTQGPSYTSLKIQCTRRHNIQIKRFLHISFRFTRNCVRIRITGSVFSFAELYLQPAPLRFKSAYI